MSDTKITNLQEVARTEKPISRILDSVVEHSARKPQPFSAYDFDRLNRLFPPVVEKAVRDAGIPTLAQDQTVMGTYGWAAQDVIYSAFAEGVVFLGYSYLATLAQRAEYRVVTETIAGEMTREWIELKAASGDDSKHDRIKAIEDRLDALDARNCFRKCAESDGFFGRGHLYLDTGMTDDSEELLSDLGSGRSVMSQTKIGPDKNQKLIGLQPVEATWAYPTHYESVDPLKRDWYSPTTWYIMSREIHKSRLLTFVSREVPDILKPAYAFGGLSMSQMLKPYVDNWLRTRQSVSDLIQNFSHNVLHTNMDATTAVGGDNMFARVALFNNIKNNQGTILVDKDAEDWSNVSVPLGGLDHLQAQAQEHMAAIARIPLVKLLGIQPAGLNASSEGELISFEDWIAALQELLFRKPLTSVIDFVQLSMWGFIDHDITFDFVPLRQLKPQEQAELSSTVAQTRELYMNMGAVDGQEVREALAQDDDAPFAGLDLSQPLPQPPMPPGGMGGPGGPGGPPGGAKPNGAGGPPMQPPMGDTRSPALPFPTGARDVGIARGFAHDAALLSHASVAFEHPAQGVDHCAQCGHYLGVDDCELVRPPVKPADWCDRFTDAEVEDDVEDDDFAEDADWDPQEHPQSAKTGQFIAKGTSEGGGAIPEPPQIQSQHAANIGKQKHLDALHAHAKAGDWSKVAAYPTPGTNTYAKKVQKYKADLLKLAPKGEGAPKSEEEAEAYKPEVPDFYKKDLGKQGFGFMGEGSGGSQLFQEPATQISVKVEPPAAESGNATWSIFDKAGKVIQEGEAAGHLEFAVKKHLAAAKSAGPSPEPAAAPEAAKVTSMEVTKTAQGMGFEVAGYGEMVNPATGHVLKVDPGGKWTIKEKNGDLEAKGDSFAELKSALEFGAVNGPVTWGSPKLEAETEAATKEAASVVKPKGASKIYSHETATKWAADPKAVSEPALRYSNGDATNETETLVIGTGAKNQGKWQIWKKGEGVVAKGSGQDELNAAFEELHPRGPGGKFAKKSSEVEHWTASSPMPDELNGVAFKPFNAPTTTAGWNKVAGQKPDLVEPDIEVPPGKHVSAGLLIQEPDGRVWLVKPKGGYGDYNYTYPKGTQDPGLSLQATAIKEAFEESGLHGEITGLAGDYLGETSITRYYLAKRIGGSPTQFEKESEGVSLVPPEKLHDFLNKERDRNIATNHFIAPPKPVIGKTVDTGAMKKVGGKLGSNPGAQYEDDEGNKYYAKFLKSPDHAKNELLAAALYNAVGSPTLNYHPDKDPKNVVTDWQEPDKKGGVKNFTPDEKREAQKHFATHAWLANWDAAGLGGDNQQIIGGKPMTVDVGGALLYRAQGDSKGSAFNTAASEWETMRDAKTNKDSADLFGGMTPAMLKNSADRLGQITDSQIRNLVDVHGPGSTVEKSALAAMLIKRKENILAKAVPPAPPKPAEPQHHPTGYALPTTNSPGAAMPALNDAAPPTASGVQRTAIKNYTDHHYREINQQLRYGLVSEHGQYGKTISQLTDWLDKADFPEDRVLTRGVDGSYAEFLKGLHIGSEFRDVGFVSMSVKKDPPMGSHTIMEVRVPKGSKAASAHHISDHHTEYEVIGQRGSYLRLVGKMPNGRLIVDLLPPTYEPKKK
jgi:hypothetical protein